MFSSTYVLLVLFHIIIKVIDSFEMFSSGVVHDIPIVYDHIWNMNYQEFDSNRGHD